MSGSLLSLRSLGGREPRSFQHSKLASASLGLLVTALNCARAKVMGRPGDQPVLGEGWDRLLLPAGP